MFGRESHELVLARAGVDPEEALRGWAARFPSGRIVVGLHLLGRCFSGRAAGGCYSATRRAVEVQLAAPTAKPKRISEKKRYLPD